MDAFHEKAPSGILWFKGEYKNICLDAEGEYFIAFKSRQVERHLDQDFYGLLQKALEEKNVGDIAEAF